MPDQSFTDDLKQVQSSFESDLKTVQQHIDEKKPVPHPIVERILSWLPVVESTAGSILGGAVAGAPGATAGGALGGMMGESQRQDVNKIVGNPSPLGTPEGEAALWNQAAAGGVGAAMGETVGPAMRYVGGKLAPALMQSAVKPGAATTAKALLKGVRGEDLPVVNSLLKEGVSVTPAGLMKLNRIITATNDEISSAVQGMSGKISPQSVATRAADTLRNAATQVTPGSDVSAVRGAIDEFLTQPGTTKAAQVGTKEVPSGVLDASGKMTTRTEPVMGRVSRDLTPAEAQAMKVGTYRAIGKRAYGEVKGAAVETEKALARGLKEDLETEAAKSGVDLKALNLREGNAMQAAEAVAKRLAVKGNHDVLGIAWLAENPASALAFAISRSPAIKSMIANGAYRSAAAAARVPESFIRGAVTSLVTSAAQDAGIAPYQEPK